ncbi:hypothetical protein FEF65_06390 [Mariprofundus erugo]|uniref:Zinc finger/thioredoxin putative domain-containing protein n=1 Tax=Mariprofundus erugo TaxID=2528639 RepID=A0A5R9GSX3_9PROT|nr:zinc-ribbon domain-containing protein [Mariprofundus erugo]TLS67543.1 hypothetical protein FEF65_06390 [Mariprofundus erugo]
MEYIQCPHCLNKYGVNDRMRQALGKQIRCKHCQQPFRIVISGTPDKLPVSSSEQIRPAEADQHHPPMPEQPAQVTPPAVVAEQVAAPATDENEPVSVEKSPRPVRLKKKLNTQFLLFAVLLTILLCAGTGLFIYTQFPQWFEKSSDRSDHVIPEELIKPMSVFPTDTSKKEVSAPQHTETGSADKSLLEGPEQPSQPCRELAAEMWIRLHLLATTKLDTQLYMQLMDQGIEQPAELRKLCKDRFLASRITDAAKQEMVPDWISHEIEKRTRKKKAEGEGPPAPQSAP